VPKLERPTVALPSWQLRRRHFPPLPSFTSHRQKTRIRFNACCLCLMSPSAYQDTVRRQNIVKPCNPHPPRCRYKYVGQPLEQVSMPGNRNRTVNQRHERHPHSPLIARQAFATSERQAHGVTTDVPPAIFTRRALPILPPIEHQQSPFQEPGRPG